MMKLSTLWHFYALVLCSICQQGVSQSFLGFLKQLKDSAVPPNIATTGVLVTHQIVNKMGAGQVVGKGRVFLNFKPPHLDDILDTFHGE